MLLRTLKIHSDLVCPCSDRLHGQSIALHARKPPIRHDDRLCLSRHHHDVVDICHHDHDEVLSPNPPEAVGPSDRLAVEVDVGQGVCTVLEVE